MYSIVLSTVNNDKTANEIARVLIENRLAACVNIVPKITSIYLWEGKIAKDSEILLIIKTKTKLYKKLEEKIKQLHPYKVPEIVSFKVQNGSCDYLNWINETV